MALYSPVNLVVWTKMFSGESTRDTLAVKKVVSPLIGDPTTNTPLALVRTTSVELDDTTVPVATYCELTYTALLIYLTAVIISVFDNVLL
jgi:hypothetical protein